MRKLAFERQQIVQRQALWLGRVQPPTYQDEDPKVLRCVEMQQQSGRHTCLLHNMGQQQQ
jgi:hypothetical protein